MKFKLFTEDLESHCSTYNPCYNKEYMLALEPNNLTFKKLIEIAS